MFLSLKIKRKAVEFTAGKFSPVNHKFETSQIINLKPKLVGKNMK